ncbi:MAG: hypothetical protein OEZ02_07680, partial [Anaerolineae bacterium]|nr:hypothetical protein [Anaerolineae bacterium]
MRTHFLLAILIAAAGLGGYARLETKAQQAVTVLNPAVEHKFGEKIIFEGDLTSEVGIGETFVFFRPEHATSAMSVPASLDANQHVTAQYTFSGGEDIKAFEKISFWFAITAGDGQLFTSDVFWFDYDDNRFEWQTLSNDHFQVHWYEGDVVFGQAVADAAENGLKHVQGLVSLPVPNQVDIYIYATPNALQTALGGNARPWIAAHADPEYNLMMLTLPSGPEQAIEMERQIPHELMHIVLYRATGVGYA